MSSIHGHEVMEMMLESPAGLTRAELEAAVAARFGVAARFHTCSREDLSISELVDFLTDAGKFDEREGKLSTLRERICKH